MHNSNQQIPHDLQPLMDEFHGLYTQKLWHQLTDKLVSFYKSEPTNPHRLFLFQTFITTLVGKINDIILVKLALQSIESLPHPEAVNLLHGLNLNINDPMAKSLLLLEESLHHLDMGDTTSAKQNLGIVKEMVHKSSSIDPSVRANISKIEAILSKLILDYSSQYRNILLYLESVPHDELSLQEKILWIHDLIIAAVLGSHIYNFGDLLNMDLDVLKGSGLEWLVNLVHTMENGSIKELDTLLQSRQEPWIRDNLVFIQEKQTLMSLLNALFHHSDKAIPLQDLSTRLEKPIPDIELLIIKAISLGLIQGEIDQPNQTLILFWIQPRILKNSEILELKQRVDMWKEHIDLFSRQLKNQVSGWIY